jgi:hypothetical protein
MIFEQENEHHKNNADFEHRRPKISVSPWFNYPKKFLFKLILTYQRIKTGQLNIRQLRISY